MGIFSLICFFDYNSAQNYHLWLVECSLDVEYTHVKDGKEFSEIFFLGSGTYKILTATVKEPITH